MNSQLLEPLVNRPRFHEWMPLIWQQMRLRSVQQIFAYNIRTENTDDVIYFTLHQSVMSAPYYTSEKLLASSNPQFAEFKLIGDGQDATLLSSEAVVLRIWLRNPIADGMDSILLSWGVHLSGLVYLGTQLSAMQPKFFQSNTLIFAMRSRGYFTHHVFVEPSLSEPLPFIDSMNVQSDMSSTYAYRLLYYRRIRTEVCNTYSVESLRRLRALQLRLRNRTLDTNRLRGELTVRSGERSMQAISDASSNLGAPVDIPEKDDAGTIIRYAPQLLTMTTLNKMLQIVPTKLQKYQINALLKDIECAKSINRLLIHERDRKTAQVRKLKEKYTKLHDDYEESNSELMENMRQLSKDSEMIKEQKHEQKLCKELLADQLNQLTTRRRKLLLDLIELYPIKNINGKYYINGVHLPNSDALNDVTDDSISVALGYVAHVLKMYEYFLQIPLRYAITHKGSQSYICDHITPAFVIKDRNFPLFTRGKDRIQFNYAVYLLNKNIAQLRWLHGQNTQNLRSTLSNLSELLSGRDKNSSIKEPTRNAHVATTVEGDSGRQIDLPDCSVDGSQSEKLPSRFGRQFLHASTMSGSCSSSSSVNNSHFAARSVKATTISSDTTEILAVPEAYLTRQLSERSLQRYAEQLECAKVHRAVTSSPQNCGKNSTADNMGSLENIEEGTDILASSLKPADAEFETIGVLHAGPTPALDIPRSHASDVCGIHPRLSRSVGSYSEDEQLNDSVKLNKDLTSRRARLSGYDVGSEPALNEDASSEAGSLAEAKHSVGIEKQEVYLRQWLETGPALICSEENLYPDEVLGVTAVAQKPSTSTSSDTQLTARANALLARQTFNLVKPKH